MRQTFSKFVLVGTLKEKSSIATKNNIEILEQKFDDGEKYLTARGRFVVESNGGEYSIDVYTTDHFKSLNDNGKHKGNSNYSDIAILSSIPIGTKIEVAVETNRFNDYKNSKGNIISIDCFSANHIKTVAEDSEDKFEGRIEGVLNSVRSEIVNEKETGRLKVELVGFNYREEPLPHTLYVEEDLRDDFESEYENGDTVVLDVEIGTKEYGTQSSKRSGGFGRKADVNNGFTRIEWIVIGGDYAYDEDSVNKKGESLLISRKEVSKALEEREVKLEAIKNDDSNNKTPESKFKSTGLKSSKALTEELNAEECPF